MVAHTRCAVGSVTGQCGTLTTSHRACEMHISAAGAGEKAVTVIINTYPSV